MEKVKRFSWHVYVVGKHWFDRALMLTAKHTVKQVSQSHKKIRSLIKPILLRNYLYREKTWGLSAEDKMPAVMQVCSFRFDVHLQQIIINTFATWSSSSSRYDWAAGIWKLFWRRILFSLFESSGISVQHTLCHLCPFSSVLSQACFKIGDKIKGGVCTSVSISQIQTQDFETFLNHISSYLSSFDFPFTLSQLLVQSFLRSCLLLTLSSVHQSRCNPVQQANKWIYHTHTPFTLP